MTDTPAPIPDAAPPAPKPVAALHITLLSDGNVSVNGPIDNLPLCAKMIAQGLGAVCDYQHRKEGARLVESAPASILRGLNGRK